LSQHDLQSAIERLEASHGTFQTLLQSVHQRLDTYEARLAQFQAQSHNAFTDGSVVSSAFSRTDPLQQILDSLPEHVAVLDGQGTIIAVNEAWRRFAERNGDAHCRDCGIGANYLQCCETCDGDALAEEAYGAIRAVLVGDLDFYTMEYPCHSPVERRWFCMQAAPLKGDRRGAVISHFDITHRKLAETALCGATGKIATLVERVQELEEENARLRKQLGLDG